MRRIPCSALAPLLSAYSMLPYGPQVQAIADQAAVTAVDDRKKFNDDKLTISLAAICDNSIGAVPAALVRGGQRPLVSRYCGWGGKP